MTDIRIATGTETHDVICVAQGAADRDLQSSEAQVIYSMGNTPSMEGALPLKKQWSVLLRVLNGLCREQGQCVCERGREGHTHRDSERFFSQ
jgi:hypothetical protein